MTSQCFLVGKKERMGILAESREEEVFRREGQFMCGNLVM